MAASYYIADGDVRRGPFSMEELGQQNLTPETLVWHEGMADWQPAGQVEELRPILGAPGVPPVAPPPPVPDYGPSINYAGVPPYNQVEVANKKLAAGICGILVGSLGIHKFILGMTTPAVIMLVVSLVGGILTCGVASMVMWGIGLAEGIIYLTKSDQDFYQTYMVGQKGWF